jgi:hypothetical protein
MTRPGATATSSQQPRGLNGRWLDGVKNDRGGRADSGLADLLLAALVRAGASEGATARNAAHAVALLPANGAGRLPGQLRNSRRTSTRWLPGRGGCRSGSSGGGGAAGRYPVNNLMDARRADLGDLGVDTASRRRGRGDSGGHDRSRGDRLPLGVLLETDHPAGFSDEPNLGGFLQWATGKVLSAIRTPRSCWSWARPEVTCAIVAAAVVP